LGVCIFFEVVLVGIPVGIALDFARRLFNPRYPNRIATCGLVAFFLGVAGLIISIQLGFYAALAAMHEGFAFSPIAWSPDGDHLAFGVEVHGFTSWTVVVMDAGGKHMKKLVDLYEDENAAIGRVEEIRWNTDGSRVLFMGTGRDYHTHYYAVDPQDESLQSISEDQFVSSPSVDDAEDAPPVQSPCSARHYIEDQAVYDNRLVAQSVCSGKQYGWTSSIGDCYQKLEICDISTGKVLLTISDYPLTTEKGKKIDKIATFAFRASIALTLIGLFVTVVTALYRWRRHRQMAASGVEVL
jgi:hypothetical protein